MINYETLKPFLFQLEPETAHNFVEKMLHYGIDYLPFVKNFLIQKLFVNEKILHQELFGKTFLNPVGIGAGFDKNGTMVRGIQALGFGYTEIGTITPKPQEGNPKPRMFRHISERTLQNAMGFNNDGAFAIEHRLKKVLPFTTPVGINIGKNKTTPEDEAIEDYRVLLETFESYADYLVINISSPNTPNLRDLQNEQFIKELFSMAKEITTKPILLKIAPDMEAKTAVSLCKSAVKAGASGIIATNTTIDYSLVKEPKDIGGLSGAVLNEKSKEIFTAIAKALFGKTTLISVGGISDGKDAYERIKLGASLVQVYTGFIYGGPTLIRDINKDIIKYLHEDGFKNITEAIGYDIKTK